MFLNTFNYPYWGKWSMI